MPYFDLTELQRLDSIIKDIENTASANAELVKRLAEFSIKVTGDILDVLATDPQSPEYLEKIRPIHEEIIGKTHSSALEGLPRLNLEYESNWPYPWGTQCAETVGRFLIAYGFLIKSADLSRGARVLEVGCGMGSLTWNLGRMGYRVDAIDPNPRQCESVAAFTRDFPVRPNVIPTTLDRWLSEKPSDYKYDAVIFFEAFHHLMDHKHCLKTLLDNHMEADGKIILAAEPVFQEICDILPYHWGPRLDGESLRAMRNWGWLELGFTEQYLRDLFYDLGLAFEWRRCSTAAPHSELIIGCRTTFNSSTSVFNTGADYHDATLSDGIDFAKESLPSFIARLSGMSGWEEWGRWSIGNTIKVELAGVLPRNFDLNLTLADVFGPNVHQTLKVRIGGQEIKQVLKPAKVASFYKFRFRAIDANLIEICIPQPTRPIDMPELENRDTRQLGIGIRSITFDKHLF